MAQADYSQLAADIVREVGGSGNVANFVHCATTLSLSLNDESKASKAKVEALEGVIAVVVAGNQFHVVIGTDVPLVHTAITELPDVASNAPEAEEEKKKGAFDKFIDMISSIFIPILWTLAGVGLLKAFIALAVNLKVVDQASTTWEILNAAGDGMFYFLPLFLAVTAAKRFNADRFTAVAIGAALVYPNIVALNAAGGPVSFFGLPVTMVSYTSSVIPILFAVWIQGYLERVLHKVLPASIVGFTTPLITVGVMVPLTLIVVGPITNILSTGISDGVMWAFDFAPWLAGAIMGGMWQVFVMFGLHWGFIPVMMNDLGTLGYSLIAGPLVAPVAAQGAAALAVLIRTRSKKRREIAAPSMLAGLLAGIAEPLIYGVNLPMKLPFYFGLAGGAVGGAIAAWGGSASDTFVMPSLLGLPAYMNNGNFMLQIIGVAAAMGIAFLLTLLFGVNKNNDRPDEETEEANADKASASA